MYAATQPHDCNAASSNTAYGMPVLTVSREVPGVGRDVVLGFGRGSRRHDPGLAFNATMRSRNGYGGTGSRAMNRPSSNGR